jgi:hypothetical protein
MAENEEGKWIWPFFLGFLLGVLVCLGGGGAYVVSLQRRAAMEADMRRMEAERAEQAAIEARAAALQALMERERAEKALKGGDKK